MWLELRNLRSRLGIQDVSRDEAESVLFKSAAALRGPVEAVRPFPEPQIARVDDSAQSSSYTPSEAEAGPVGDAAIILKDPGAWERTLADLRATAAVHNLQAVTAREASGVMAQYLDLVRVMLYTGLVMVFLTVLLVLNTAVAVTTLARVREMGTLRTIGAHRELVLAIVALEVALVALVSSAAGAALGVGLLHWPPG